jgi:hypothetical protein
MIHEFKKVWKPYTIGLLWLLGLLWPLLGIHPDGTLTFDDNLYRLAIHRHRYDICLLLYIMNKSGQSGCRQPATCRTSGHRRAGLGQGAHLGLDHRPAGVCLFAIRFLPDAMLRTWPPMC